MGGINSVEWGEVPPADGRIPYARHVDIRNRGPERAFDGVFHPKPTWLAEREAIQERQIESMDLPEEVAEKAIRRVRRA